MENFLERIAKHPILFDGAMGTMIYHEGVFINTCYDNLNLVNKPLIRKIHGEYIEAGAEAIETNTFGANRLKLREFGLAENVKDINKAGVQLAKETIGENNIYTAGCVGPALNFGEKLKEAESINEVEDAFREQIETLASSGADILILETFSCADELKLAAKVAKETSLPVIASFTANQDGMTVQGVDAGDIAADLNNNPDVDVVGINCTLGPSESYYLAQRLLRIVDKPFSVMPNLGSPQKVGGRVMYMSEAEYFTEYAKRLVAMGVKIIGGCCGTSAKHIRLTSKTLSGISEVKSHIEIKEGVRKKPVEIVPTEKKSAFAAKLSRGEAVSSIEVLPPATVDLTRTFERIKKIKERGVDVVNIPDGPRASSRLNALMTGKLILDEVGIEPVPHFCCRDRNLIGMQGDILAAQAAGIRNILFITGDPPKVGDYPDVTGVFDVDAIGLAKMADNLNKGTDLGGNDINPPTSIFVGVGANPCAVELEKEIDRYLLKIEAGADFAVTQPVFDPEALLKFLDTVEKQGKTIPVVAGIWPLVSLKNAEFMRNEVPGVVIPDAIMDKLKKCKTREECRETGTEIAIDIKKKIEDRVQGFQVSAPMGNIDIALKVLDR